MKQNRFINNILNEVYGYYTKGLLTEAKQLVELVNSFQKNNPNIDTDELSALLKADPTFVSNDRGEFVGKYGVWIGNQYVKGNIHRGDIPELKGALKTYNINKSQLEFNIKDIGTLDELVHLIAPYNDAFTATRTIGKTEKEIEKVYEDNNVTIYIPHTWEADRKLGGDTKWCTAADNDGEYFNYYLNEYGGEYYVIIRKKDGSKYQLHVESEQFMDANDIETNFCGVCDNRNELEPIVKFFESRGKDVSQWVPIVFFGEVQGMLDSGVSPKRVFDEVREFYEGCARVYLNCKWNFINQGVQILSPDQWFDGSGNFQEGLARVQLNRKWNFINKEGLLLSPDQWFDGAGNFQEGFAWVKLNDKNNFINQEGRLLSDQWFDGVGSFSEGFGCVELNGKYNFINQEGLLLSPNQWFDYVDDFSEGFAVVELNDMGNFINKEGLLLSPDQWFDGVGRFREGIARVRLNGKYNFINQEVQILSPDQWFDGVGRFREGIARVKLNGKYYFIDKEGTLYDYNTKQPIQSLNKEQDVVTECVRRVINEYLYRK